MNPPLRYWSLRDGAIEKRGYSLAGRINRSKVAGLRTWPKAFDICAVKVTQRKPLRGRDPKFSRPVLHANVTPQFRCGAHPPVKARGKCGACEQGRLGMPTTAANDVNHSAKARVAGIVTEILARRALNRQVKADDDLQNVGLTSLDMVNLMLSVEAEFELKIPDAEMTPRNFRTISAIDTLVNTLLRKK
jgi:acyl carrier protein